MESADFIVDIGPGAGVNGGEIVSKGDLCNRAEVKLFNRSISKWREKNISIPKKRRTSSKKIKLTGCTGNNLKNINVEFPLGIMIGVTGVSGSGKSN